MVYKLVQMQCWLYIIIHVVVVVIRFYTRWSIFVSISWSVQYTESFENWYLIGKGNAGVPGRGQVTLSADTVNFWSCMWSCGWPRGAAASFGSTLSFLLQRKHRHVTPIMTYIKTTHYVSHREREPDWKVTFPPSIDVWRWHHLHRPSHLPWVKRCGSLIAAPGFGSSLFSYHSHIQGYSVDKRQQVSVEKSKRSAAWHLSNVLLFLSAVHRINVEWMHKHFRWRISCCEQSVDNEAVAHC